MIKNHTEEEIIPAPEALHKLLDLLFTRVSKKRNWVNRVGRETLIQEPCRCDGVWLKPETLPGPYESFKLVLSEHGDPIPEDDTLIK